MGCRAAEPSCSSWDAHQEADVTPSLSATVQAAARTQRDLLLLSFCRLEAPHGEPVGWSQRGTGYLHPAKAAFLPSPHRGRGEGALWGIFLSGF